MKERISCFAKLDEETIKELQEMMNAKNTLFESFPGLCQFSKKKFTKFPFKLKEKRTVNAIYHT